MYLLSLSNREVHVTERIVYLDSISDKLLIIKSGYFQSYLGQGPDPKPSEASRSLFIGFCGLLNHEIPCMHRQRNIPAIYFCILMEEVS